MSRTPYNMQRTPNEVRTETTSGRIRNNGIYIGIVKDNADAQRMGRLSVWIPEIGGNPDNPVNWFTVSYASPFAGSTPLKNNTDGGKKMQDSQQSYGFWMVPPDIDNMVLVCFVAGDSARGFWFACVYQQFMNHMVPGIALNVSTDDNINRDNLPPVVEYNRKDPEQDVWDPKRPVFEPLHEAFKQQGLYKDPERGPATTSGRREAPSKVFGMSTPRGHVMHVDEDQDNEFIRFRTRSGVQLLIHETTGYIYMNSKEGNSWMEISDEGINMYSKKSISIRSEENVNIHADKNIMKHGGAIHSRGGNITTASERYITETAEVEISRDARRVREQSGHSATPPRGWRAIGPGSGTGSVGASDGSQPSGSLTAAPQGLGPTAGHYALADSMRGLRENDPQGRSTLANFFAQSTGRRMDPAQTPWCAAFANGVLKQAGLRETGDDRASSFLNYGNRVTENPQQGDIAVIRTGGSGSGYHVGFFSGYTTINGRQYVQVLGGNQSDQVKISNFPVSQLSAIRRPPDAATIQSNPDLRQVAQDGGLGGSPAENGQPGVGTPRGSDPQSTYNTALTGATSPPAPGQRQDTVGESGNYRQTSRSTVVTSLPTHEPWTGHPQAKKPPRGGLGSETGTGSSTPGGGEGTPFAGGSAGSGTSNPDGSSASSGGGSSGNAPPLSGTVADRANNLYNGLVAKGWTPTAATAMVGNILGENGKLDPGIMVSDPSRSGQPGMSRGYAQWRNERGLAFENWANQQGYPGGWRNEQANIDYIDYEMRNKFPGVFRDLQNAGSTEQAMNLIVRKYEIPADPDGEIRKRLANVNRFQNRPRPERGDPGMNPAGNTSTPPATANPPSPPAAPPRVATSPSIDSTR